MNTTIQSRRRGFRLLPQLPAVALFAIFSGATSLSAATISVPATHKTIQAGIDAAKPGDVVVVEPGVYKERIHLKPGITLRSAGDNAKGKLGLKRAEATIIDAGGKMPGVEMAEGSTLDGLTVTHAGKFDQAEFDKHYESRGEHLPDEQGAVGFEDSEPAVQVTNVTATVKNCIVHDNGHAGIGVGGKKNASQILSNVVYRNMGGGIGLANGTTALAKGNTCFQNLRGGLGCRASSPEIRENRSYDNVRAGIGIREGATPLVIDNECFGNRRAGIGNRMKGTAATIKNNRCYRNGMAGIGTRNQATPRIEGNECFENEMAGIGATADARPTIIGNKIYGNKLAAIGLDRCQAGKAVIKDNEITATTLVAIGINPGWTVEAEGNQISRKGGMPPLVMVFKGAKATFTKNEFTGSGVAAIRSQGEIVVKGNTFKCPAPRKGGPPQFAVWALEGSKVEFTDDNTVEGWREAVVGP
ncbi:MAG: right-handed parallel beta-helix repeat-containing protein [Boseongicola sp.]|nr:right-handed parallel beta-helix repeat-containing protein [Boseongicola sp.]